MAMAEILPLIPPWILTGLERGLNREDWYHAVRERTYLEHGCFCVQSASIIVMQPTEVINECLG